MSNGNGVKPSASHAPKKKNPPPEPATPSKADPSSVKESRVTFQTPDGFEMRGQVLRMTRFSAYFEVHNPSVVLRVSDVLKEFKIIVQGRTIYSGRGLTVNVVNADMKMVCEVALDEADWTYLDFSLVFGADGQLAKEFKSFIEEWQKLYKVLPEYKIVLTDMQMFLSDLRIWLDQIELGMRNEPVASREKLEQRMVLQLESEIVPLIWSFFERYEIVAKRVDEDLVPAHHVFGKRLLHPLLLESPFVRRTFTKPRGYAGDYEMVNMMLRSPFEGATLFAKVINLYALQLPPVIAHRNRITYLTKQIETEIIRLAKSGRQLRVYNFACGPAVEVQRFFDTSPLSEKVEFTLADFDSETLEYTESVIAKILKQWNWESVVRYKKTSVQQLLKENQKSVVGKRLEYDFVYCAGLFDYLPDTTCKMLMNIFYDMLAPGGLLVATNVDRHAGQMEMECFLEWRLVYRDTAQMRLIAPDKATDDDISLRRDETGVNIFLEVRKPDIE